MTPQNIQLKQKAVQVAITLHNGQYRKVVDENGSNIPFSVHPIAVGFLLEDYAYKPEVVIAGMLHDVLEDVEGYTYEMMRADFTQHIADIVQGVTHEYKESWKQTRVAYLKNLEDGSLDSLAVAVADKIHNASSMTQGARIHGKQGMWSQFKSSADPSQHLWFYESVHAIAQKRMPQDQIVQHYANTIQELKTRAY